MEAEAPDSIMEKVIKEGKDRAKMFAGLGGLIFIISTIAALGGATDGTHIECTRAAPESTVDCVVVRSFLGVERMRLELHNVLRAEYRYNQRDRGTLAFVDTSERDDIYLETTSEDATLQLSAFIAHKSSKRFEWKNEPPAVFHVAVICFGALLGLFGLIKWLAWRRKRLM